MEPFRAFVAHLLPEDQRTQGFAMQSLFIGLGAVVASSLPWLLTNAFGVARQADGGIPWNVKLSFCVGAVAMLGAVLWTIVSTREHPPQDWKRSAGCAPRSRGSWWAAATSGSSTRRAAV